MEKVLETLVQKDTIVGVLAFCGYGVYHMVKRALEDYREEARTARKSLEENYRQTINTLQQRVSHLESKDE